MVRPLRDRLVPGSRVLRRPAARPTQERALRWGPVSLVDAPAAAEPVKPRLRGWLHFWSFVVAVFAGITLVTLAWSTVSGRAAAAVAVYVVTVWGVFGISALYHRRTWVSAGMRTLMKRLDHAMIFLFIAGTYTPFTVLALSGTTRTVVLWVVWVGALGGVALKLAWPHAPRWIGVPFYLALGWVAVFVLVDILQLAGVTAMVLLAAGGLLYSVGAIAYATKKPNPWPGVFGYHEVFHAMTIVAAICHYIAVYFAIFNSPFA